MDTLFGESAVEESKQFALHYQRAAAAYKTHFLDTAPFIQSSKVDGIHLEVTENKKLAEKLAEKVKQIFAV